MTSEAKVQTAFVKYLREHRYKINFSCSVGGFKTHAMRNGMYWRGYESGVPDLMIFEPRGKYHGMFIEFKNPGKGVLSKKQINFIESLRLVGYYVSVHDDADKAIIDFEEYFSQPTYPQVGYYCKECGVSMVDE